MTTTRRLLYVALTRARDLLVVTGPEAEGEGEWPRLRDALLRESPFRVTVARPGEGLSALPVRAGWEPVATESPEGSEPAGVTEAPRRRLALTSNALQDIDFAWCPRRFHARHELRLSEQAPSVGDVYRGGGDRPEGALATATLDALVRTPDAGFSRGPARCWAYRRRAPRPEIAKTLVQRFAESEVGAAIADMPAAVMGRGLPYALALPRGRPRRRGDRHDGPRAARRGARGAAGWWCCAMLFPPKSARDHEGTLDAEALPRAPPATRSPSGSRRAARRGGGSRGGAVAGRAPLASGTCAR